ARRAHHRDLPSLPTRRSSDLAPTIPGTIDLASAPNSDTEAAAAWRISLDSCLSIWLIASSTSSLGSATLGSVYRTADTSAVSFRSEEQRLNSSHRTISYAVFC